MAMDLVGGVGIQWTEQAVHLKDFAAKHPLPNVVKVIKGQYRNIDVSKSVHSELYIHGVQTTNKVLAEAIKLRDGRTKMTVSEQKYSMPLSYKGWFELLSQDGKSVKAIQNVHELARFFPPTCLVRENIKAFVAGSGPELSADRTRVVLAGEVLSLVAEMWLPFSIGKSVAKRRVLKCTDSKSNPLFFGLDQKGIFSPIAGQTNISGVHSIKGLMDKFRLPLLVRLVHGVIPSKMEKGFNGIFRLVSVYSDENAFVCPLRKDAKMVPISTREALKVVVAQDYKTLLKLDDIRVIQKRCVDMLESYMNSIHILISMPDVAMMKGKEEFKTNALTNEPLSDPADRPTSPGISKDEEDLLFEEIDGIYQYVREGGLPPKPKVHLPKRLHREDKSPSAKKPIQTSKLVAGYRVSQSEDDPTTEIKMKQLDLLDEDDDDDKGTTLRRQDGYSWVEPIYEPLDKIREQKKKLDVNKTTHDGQPAAAAAQHSGFDTPPDSLYKVDVAKAEDQANRAAARPKRVSTSLDDLGAPVANLRQVMRSNSCTPTNLRPNSLALREDQAIFDKEPQSRPPPLPPKRYNSTPNEVLTKSNVNLQPRKSALFANNRSRPMSPTHQSGHAHGNGCQISASSCALQKQPDARIQAAGTRLAPTHPPYIAVARVPGYQHEPGKASVLANPDICAKQQNNVHNGHKLHSMYL